jgi:signal transduction histidine kinase
MRGQRAEQGEDADHDQHPHRWQRWQLPVRLERPGGITVRAGATDAAGRTQPDQPHWNPLGYTANPVHHVGQLVTGTAEAGVRVQLEIRGTQRPVPPGLDLAAYRIIQEALTNVVRHAHTTASRVLVTYTDDAMDLEITDDGAGAPAGAVAVSAGHGIAGMRERASLFGGEFHAEPLPGRGFRVAARLPLGSSAAEPPGRAIA